MARFIRLPGTNRRYLDTDTGKTVSRRQRDALAGRRRVVVARAVRNAQKRYNSLLRDFIDKQVQLGKYEWNLKGKDKYRGLRKKARESVEMKQIVKDLKSPDPLIKLRALKQTTRRDGIPDTVMVGESPKMETGL